MINREKVNWGKKIKPQKSERLQQKPNIGA